LRRRRPTSPRLLLRLRDPQRHLRAVGRRNVTPQLLSGRQPRLNVAERNGVDADAELGAPFLGDGFGHSGDTGFGEGVVDLAGVAVDAGGAAYVYDVAGFAVYEARVVLALNSHGKSSGF